MIAGIIGRRITRTGRDEKTGSENSQEVIDKEIEHAHKTGIDYWAFIDAPNTDVDADERYAMGNRPLIYISNIYDMETEFGVGQGTLNAISTLRHKAEAVGLKPYIAVFSFGVGANIDKEIARKAHEYKLDSLSCYGVPGEGNDGDLFSKLATQVRKKWETKADRTENNPSCQPWLGYKTYANDSTGMAYMPWKLVCESNST